MSSPISAQYLERKLRAIVGVQGQNPIPELDDVKKGLIVLEADRPEWQLAGGERPWVWCDEAPGAVAELSYLTLENPANSGVLAIIEAIESQYLNVPGNSASFVVQIELAPLVIPPLGQLTTSTPLPRDLRPQSFNVSALLGRTGNDAAPLTGAGPTISYRINMPGKSALDGGKVGYWAPFMMGPGSRLWLIAKPTNAPINARITGRERPIESVVEVK